MVNSGLYATVLACVVFVVTERHGCKEYPNNNNKQHIYIYIYIYNVVVVCSVPSCANISAKTQMQHMLKCGIQATIDY